MAIGNSFENPALSYECDLTAERDALRKAAAQVAIERDRLLVKNARLREALQEIYTRHLAKAAAGQLTVCERTTRERAHAALDAHEARRKK